MAGYARKPHRRGPHNPDSPPAAKRNRLQSGRTKEDPVDDATIRQTILDHYAAAGTDERRIAQIYADDVILDFPQGGEPDS